MAISRKKLTGIIVGVAGLIGAAALWLTSGRNNPQPSEPPLKYDRDIKTAHKNAGRELAVRDFPWGTLTVRKRDKPYVAGGINMSCDGGIKEKCYSLIAIYKPAAAYPVLSMGDVSAILSDEFGGVPITGLGKYFALVNAHIPYRQTGDLIGYAIKDLPVWSVADYFDGRGKHMQLMRDPTGRQRALILECQYASATPDASIHAVPYWYEGKPSDSDMASIRGIDSDHPALKIAGPAKSCPLRPSR